MSQTRSTQPIAKFRDQIRIWNHYANDKYPDDINHNNIQNYKITSNHRLITPKQNINIEQQVFESIKYIEPQLAEKITGMLVDAYNTSTLSQLLVSPSSLHQQINSAKTLLHQDHQQKVLLSQYLNVDDTLFHKLSERKLTQWLINDLLKSATSGASTNMLRQKIGDKLFPKIHCIKPSLSAKITGVMLEAYNYPELLIFLCDTQALVKRMDEISRLLIPNTNIIIVDIYLHRFIIEIHPYDNIYNLKQMISNITGIPCCVQILKYNGRIRILNDTLLIHDCVSHTIDLSFEIQGKEGAFIAKLNGNNYFNRNIWTKAIEEYNQISNLDYECYYKRSISHFESRNFEEAIQDSKKCIELFPHKIQMYVIAGSSLAELGILGKAKEIYDIGMELYPENDELLQGMEGCRLLASEATHNGLRHMIFRNWSDAVLEYKKAVCIYDDDHISFANLSISYGELEEWEHALYTAEKCIEIKRDWSEGHGLAGNALWNLDKEEEAKVKYDIGIVCDAHNVLCKEGLLKYDCFICKRTAHKLQKDCDALTGALNSLTTKYNGLKKRSIALSMKQEHEINKLRDIEKKYYAMCEIDILWQWKNEDNEWNYYDEKTSLSLECLGIDWYLTYKCEGNGQMYKIVKESNDSGFQINTYTNMKRIVRRIKQNVSKYPDIWNCMFLRNNDEDKYAKCELFSIDLNDLEEQVQNVFQRFYSTIFRYNIVKIECVQNKYLWDRYCNAKHVLMKSMGKSKVNEKWLFHGTSQDTMNVITKEGFRKEYNQTHQYGEGTYFARDASYSAYYSQNVKGISKMFLCKVCIGEMRVGNSCITLQNWPKKKDGLIYDVLVNNIQDASIFVIHDDVRAYPMFVIHFKDK